MLGALFFIHSDFVRARLPFKWRLYWQRRRLPTRSVFNFTQFSFQQSPTFRRTILLVDFWLVWWLKFSHWRWLWIHCHNGILRVESWDERSKATERSILQLDSKTVEWFYQSNASESLVYRKEFLSDSYTAILLCHPPKRFQKGTFDLWTCWKWNACTRHHIFL